MAFVSFGRGRVCEGLCGNHQNIESSGTRCYLNTQEKDNLNYFIEIYSH